MLHFTTDVLDVRSEPLPRFEGIETCQEQNHDRCTHTRQNHCPASRGLRLAALINSIVFFMSLRQNHCPASRGLRRYVLKTDKQILYSSEPLPRFEGIETSLPENDKTEPFWCQNHCPASRGLRLVVGRENYT